MKISIFLMNVITVLALPLLALSASGVQVADKNTEQVVVAKFAAEPIKLDGRLNEGAWANAPAYSLMRPLKANFGLPESMQRTVGENLREKCTVKLLWDDNNLYVGAEAEDSDVMNEGKEDQTHLYRTGDLIEVFLKPADENYYWEIYGSANSKKTWFAFPSRGRGTPSVLAYLPEDLKVSCAVDGTLNNWRDKDKGWTVEIMIPIKELTAKGIKFDNSANWTVLIARYNYSRFLPAAELSSFPLLSNPNFHIYEEYAKLVLEK
jgi:hypothetical protein